MRFIAFLLCWLVLGFPGWVFSDDAHKPSEVETSLILAIDASASISSDFLQNQIIGHALAFRDSGVQQAFLSLEKGVALRVLLWSSPQQMMIPLPWVIVRNAQDANRFADQLVNIALPQNGGSTAIGTALHVSGDLLRTAPFSSNKKIIDLVSNGFSNAGPDPAPIRDQLVATGVTINGLVVTNEYDWLETYFIESVIGGNIPFVSSVDNPIDYVNALRRKLVQELS